MDNKKKHCCQQLRLRSQILALVVEQYIKKNYFFLCLFFLKRFLRLWVAILCLFLFLPLGIILNFKYFYKSVY